MQDPVEVQEKYRVVPVVQVHLPGVGRSALAQDCIGDGLTFSPGLDVGHCMSQMRLPVGLYAGGYYSGNGGKEKASCCSIISCCQEST